MITCMPNTVRAIIILDDVDNLVMGTATFKHVLRKTML